MKRHDAEIQLATLEAVVDSLTEGLIIAGVDGRLIEMNAEALRLHGFSDLAEARRYVEEYGELFELRTLQGTRLHEDAWPIARALRGERFQDLDVEVCRQDTGVCWLASYSGTPIVRDGEVVLAVLTLRDITLRKRNEVALAERELWFRTLFNAVNDAVYVYPLNEDGPGRFTEVNEEACERLGYTRAELLKRSVRDLAEPAIPLDQFLAQLRHDGHVVVESTHRTRDGRRLPVEVNAVLFEHRGRPTVLSVCRDLTERKEAAEAVRQREEAFTTLANSIPQLAWMADAEGGIFWFNERWYDYTGTSFEEVKGWGWRQVHHPEHDEGVIQRFRRAVADGVPWEDTYPIRSADGGYRWFLSRALPVYDDQGSIHRWFGTNTDVTERLEMEEALRESEERYRSLMESVPQMMWVLRPDGTIDYFNQRWTEYTGLPARAPGPRWPEAIHPEDRHRLLSLRAAAIAGEEPYEVELRVRRTDGAYRWHLARVAPMYRDGVLFAWLGTATDIDERRRAEESLRAMNETLEARVEQRTTELLRSSRELAHSNLALQQRNRELQDFAYVASHDLQEPLRKIRTFADLLQAEYEPKFDDQGRYFLDRIEDAAGRASRLIQDLLAFSRVMTRVEPFETVELATVIAEVTEDLDLLLSESGAVISVDATGSIEADRSQLRQLLQNLIQNAVKFRREGTAPSVRIACSFEEVDDPDGEGARSVCCIEVEDNGIGFEEKYLDRIFAPFQRLHGRSTYPGTGMGLAICRRIVERHRGDITARSAPGEGATFIVRLPVQQEGGSHGEDGAEETPLRPVV